MEYTIDNGFQIAQKRTRIFAFLADLSIFCLIGILLGFFFGEPIEGIGFELTGIPALAMMLIGFFLWPISEGIWGQTLGKRMLNIKVVTDHHEPIDITASITRNILGFIDYIFLLGILIASSNKMNKRIGDMAANTLVIQM